MAGSTSILQRGFVLVSVCLVAGCVQDTTPAENTTPDGRSDTAGNLPTVVLDSERYPTDRPRLSGVAYYVSPNGNDANAGTIDSPWATIQHAAEVMEPGNVVYLREGVYHEAVTTAKGGTPSGDLVFAAFSGEQPIIDGTGVDAGDGFVVAHDYIVLQGLTIRNWPISGIWMENAAYPYLTDCEVYDVTNGIGGSNGTHDLVLDHVVAHHFDLYGFDLSPGNANCYNGTFWQCVAHTRRDPEQNVDGFALGHGTQYGFLFYRCHAYGVFDGFDISSRDVLLERCSAYECDNAGFKVWQDNVKLVNCLSYENGSANLELDWDGSPGTVTVQNCTFVGSDTFNIWIENSNDALRMYNTIVAGGRGTGMVFEQRDARRYQGDYNLLQDQTGRTFVVGYQDEFSLQQLDAWRAYSGQDANSLTASTLAEIFVDPSSFDFHLAAVSPAIDRGTFEGAPTNDYDGTSRPQGPRVDIGAFER